MFARNAAVYKLNALPALNRLTSSLAAPFTLPGESGIFTPHRTPAGHTAQKQAGKNPGSFILLFIHLENMIIYNQRCKHDRNHRKQLDQDIDGRS